MAYVRHNPLPWFMGWVGGFVAGAGLVGAAVFGYLLGLGPLAVGCVLTMILGAVAAVFPYSWFCPQCRRRIPRMEEKRPHHFYFCAACDVEWNTGARDDK